MSAKTAQNFLYRECGLKGLSGISNDVRELQFSADPRAAFALDHFCYRVGLNAGMLGAALGGVDALVFNAGIGENSPAIRAHIAAWLGAVLDPQANALHASRISAPHSRVALYVIPTDEELMIARHTLATLSAPKAIAIPKNGAPNRLHRRQSL
jgi:acetate kinase